MEKAENAGNQQVFSFFQCFLTHQKNSNFSNILFDVCTSLGKRNTILKVALQILGQ